MQAPTSGCRREKASAGTGAGAVMGGLQQDVRVRAHALPRERSHGAGGVAAVRALP